ncbi:MAG TPA: hypothetical protein VEA69_00245, partial [Tepidisphaeraceae bacterium]|nr:hypothetical protein [Tepidisphaeraceae bacterium]
MAANRWTCVRAVGVVLFAAIVVAGGPGRAGAADDPPRLVDADNPAYKGWADRKPGTWLKIRGQFGEAADRKNATLTEGTHVLAAVTPEKVTLKVTQRLTTAGRAGDERTREHDEPARTQVPWTAVKVRPKTEKVTVPA